MLETQGATDTAKVKMYAVVHEPRDTIDAAKVQMYAAVIQHNRRRQRRNLHQRSSFVLALGEQILDDVEAAQLR